MFSCVLWNELNLTTVKNGSLAVKIILTYAMLYVEMQMEMPLVVIWTKNKVEKHDLNRSIVLEFIFVFLMNFLEITFKLTNFY